MVNDMLRRCPAGFRWHHIHLESTVLLSEGAKVLFRCVCIFAGDYEESMVANAFCSFDLPSLPPRADHSMNMSWGWVHVQHVCVVENWDRTKTSFKVAALQPQIGPDSKFRK